VSAKDDAAAWLEAVQGLAKQRGIRYEPVGGLNPRDAPPALCPGGTNWLTGELEPGFWGASCDADEREQGGFGRRAVVPGALLAKTYMPDLATVVPIFNVESLERTAGDTIDRHSRRRVEFESLEFNKRFIATVPRDHDPIALRELFSPGFLVWTTSLPAEVDFGITDQQAFFHWKLREHTRDELEQALKGAGGIFERIRREMIEKGIDTYRPGPWHAGMEAFPARQG
jgi:hypothetical protein